MIKSVVLTLIVVVGSLHGLGTITRVSLQPSDCENCGMTALGQVRQHWSWYHQHHCQYCHQVNLKICGGSSEPCCGIVNIANFDSLNEGQIYDYTGEHELEDCFKFMLDQVDNIGDFSMTLYHEGSDGGQFDWIEVVTDDTAIIRCDGAGVFLDGFDNYTPTCSLTKWLRCNKSLLDY